MDNHFIVGIGNIYANEILFSSLISPLSPSFLLTSYHCKKLYKNIIKTLKNAINLGGSTIKNYRDPNGKEGLFSQKFNVYGREKQNCYNCDKIIIKKIMSGRSSFFCPNCQKELKV